MIKIKKVIAFIAAAAMIMSAAAFTSFAGNAQSNGWGVASWYCEKADSDFNIDYNAIRTETISECNKEWNLSSQEEWNNDQYEIFINRVDEAVEKVRVEYESENISYNIVVAFSMPEDPSYLYNYVPNCKPYVYLKKNGETYSRTPLTLMSADSGYAIATITVNGYGEYEGMICHNGIDGTATAQSADYNNFSTISMSVYNGGIKCKYTNKMNESFARDILDNYFNIAEIKNFTDVSENDWYYNDIVQAVKMDLIEGKSDTRFFPRDNMTYAEAITLAARINVLFKGKDPYLYFDSNCSPWYKTYVNFAKANEIPWRYSDYDKAITRAEYIHIFHAAVPESELEAINKIPAGSIPDVPSDSLYADEIYDFYRAGIICGSDEDGNFNPDDCIKRSEVAAILCRIMGENRQSFTLE
ncbi:MAG: S-layer homology domain-containing protein [Bacillota bacterium]|nr:S-layer homology domain-containing protein [Bacillota bacterium]